MIHSKSLLALFNRVIKLLYLLSLVLLHVLVLREPNPPLNEFIFEVLDAYERLIAAERPRAV